MNAKWSRAVAYRAMAALKRRC